MSARALRVPCPADDLIWMWAGAPPGPRIRLGPPGGTADRTNNVGGTRSLRRMPPGLPRTGRTKRRTGGHSAEYLSHKHTHAGASAPAKRTAAALPSFDRKDRAPKRKQKTRCVRMLWEIPRHRALPPSRRRAGSPFQVLRWADTRGASYQTRPAPFPTKRHHWCMPGGPLPARLTASPNDTRTR